MNFTVLVMVLVIVWAIKNLVKELGLFEVARHKIKKKCDVDD